MIAMAFGCGLCKKTCLYCQCCINKLIIVFRHYTENFFFTPYRNFFVTIIAISSILRIKMSSLQLINVSCLSLVFLTKQGNFIRWIRQFFFRDFYIYYDFSTTSIGFVKVELMGNIKYFRLVEINDEKRFPLQIYLCKWKRLLNEVYNDIYRFVFFIALFFNRFRWI